MEFLLHNMSMQNQLINITYNNEVISVRRDASLQSMLSNKKLIQLPISIWKDIFIQKDGIVLEVVLKEILLKQINNHDVSNSINEFFINGKGFWLDKNTRLSLQQLVNSSDSNVQIVLGDNIFTLSTEFANNFLSQLEVYAGKCFLQTAKHKLMLKNLNTIEDLVNYDYTRGYPQKLNFTI